VDLAVLAVSAVFEGFSYKVAYREYRRIVRNPAIRNRPVGIWRFLVVSKDPNLFTNLLGSAAAFIGLGLAGFGVIGSGWLGWEWADGVASVGVGVLLFWVALFMANETRSLIAGEAAAPAIVETVCKAVREGEKGGEVVDVASLHLGPQAILIALTVRFEEKLAGEDLLALANDLIARARGADERVKDVFLRPADQKSISIYNQRKHGTKG